MASSASGTTEAPSVPALRPLVACLLLVLLVAAPAASADLTVATQQGSTYDIFTSGSSTLAAPQNATIRPAWGGYLVAWDPPAVPTGTTLTGYTLYRLPAPGTAGGLVTQHLPARWPIAYDRPGTGTYVYFATASFGASESVPGGPVSTLDVGSYPHCGVVGVSFTPPYYDSHLDCLFPLP